jgi:hypothetical protein
MILGGAKRRGFKECESSRIWGVRSVEDLRGGSVVDSRSAKRRGFEGCEASRIWGVRNVEDLRGTKVAAVFQLVNFHPTRHFWIAVPSLLARLGKPPFLHRRRLTGDREGWNQVVHSWPQRWKSYFLIHLERSLAASCKPPTFCHVQTARKMLSALNNAATIGISDQAIQKRNFWFTGTLEAKCQPLSNTTSFSFFAQK